MTMWFPLLAVALFVSGRSERIQNLLLTASVGALVVVREPLLEDDQCQLAGFRQRWLLHLSQLQHPVDL